MDIKYHIENEYMKYVLQINGLVVRVPGSCPAVGSGRVRGRNRNKPKEANVIGNISKDMSDIDLTTVISEANLVGSNPKEWWVDTGTTRHVCSDKKMFSTFEPIQTGEKVFMGNSTTSDIKGQGKVVLMMTSRKEMTLTNVLYEPEIRKN